ncbi:MAG: 50S ribosomal protein L18 [Planctomycetes bacterium]|nr:50S ribosomal protein L18 [Planctomycetota bacterium]
MNKVERSKKRVFRRKMRVRNRIRASRTPRVRMSIHKTAKHMYVQVIDDAVGRTLCSASTLDKEVRGGLEAGNGGNVAAAKQVGALIAKRAKEAGVEKVAFDRGAFRFHGRVKALADAAREGGLSF